MDKVKELLKLADIKVNGKRDHDIQVKDPRFYNRVLAGGSLALGESYMDGWWDCKALDKFFFKILKAKLDQKIKPASLAFHVIKAKLLNQQTKQRSKKVAQDHYDLGNDLYERMLDKHMQYTCAYWKNAKNLDEAQENKLKLVCDKLHLKPGMTVLELGGGFGGLATYMAKHYDCNVISYNISKEQVKYAREKSKGLPVKFIQADYREAKGTFDRVVSVGMCEHVGYKNYASFMKLAHDRLKDDGLFLLHTIGSNTSTKHTDRWIDKYIFPNSKLPSINQLSKAAEGKFIIEDLHNFGQYYDNTLMAWHENFNTHWNELKDKYGERFKRMWDYYLLSCAGSFRARAIQLWQFVLSKELVGGYTPVR